MHEKLEKSNGGFNYNINNCIFEMNADVNHLPFHFHNLLRNLISTSENLVRCLIITPFLSIFISMCFHIILILYQIVSNTSLCYTFGCIGD